MNKDQGRGAVDEIQTLIEGFGAPNEQALNRLKHLVSSLRDTLTGEYVTEKLDHLEHWAAIGFSTKEFSRFPGGTEGVKDSARASLMALKNAVSKLPTAT
jgi:hypothetical protein